MRLHTLFLTTTLSSLAAGCSQIQLRLTFHPDTDGHGAAHTALVNSAHKGTSLPGIGTQRSFKFNEDLLQPTDVTVKFTAPDGGLRYWDPYGVPKNTVFNIGFAAAYFAIVTFKRPADAPRADYSKGVGVYNLTEDGNVVWTGPLPETARLAKRAVDFPSQTFTYADRTVQAQQISLGSVGAPLESDEEFAIACELTAYGYAANEGHSNYPPSGFQRTVVEGGQHAATVEWQNAGQTTYDDLPVVIMWNLSQAFQKYIVANNKNSGELKIYDMNNRYLGRIGIFGRY